MKTADILDQAKEIFEACEAHDDENRQAALDDLRFARLGEQWHPEDEIQRRKDGRPCLTINRLPAFIRQVVNDARQNTPAITVRAVALDMYRYLGESAQVRTSCTADAERAKGDLVCFLSVATGAATCHIGVDMITGRSTSGVIC